MVNEIFSLNPLNENLLSAFQSHLDSCLSNPLWWCKEGKLCNLTLSLPKNYVHFLLIVGVSPPPKDLFPQCLSACMCVTRLLRISVNM